MTLPRSVLSDVAWTFQRNSYKDVPSFARAVEMFHTQTYGVAPAWKPDAIAIPAATIRVRLGARRVPQMDSAGKLAEIKRRGGDRMITLRAPSPKGFTNAQLLFELHNHLRAGLDKEPDRFLDQLAFIEEAKLFEPVLYELRTKYWLATDAEKPRGELPPEVMRKVIWSFAEPTISDRAEFIARALAHEAEILATLSEPRDPQLHPDALVIPAPVIWVSHADRAMFLLRSDDPGGFTAGELLHKLHAELAPKLKNRDHHFFEGLHGLAQPDGMPPGYFVHLGS